MNIDILLGLQWGDEGKGKIVDVLSPRYDIIARFQGGPNAGHSLEFNNVKHVLHLIPSGIFHPDKINVIGNGMVIDPAIFRDEILNLGLPTEEIANRLVISNKAHLILPTHRALDAAYEQGKGDLKIGSTLKGIGPAYTDKTGRNGLRIGDILKKDFIRIYEDLRMAHKSILDSFNYSYETGEYEAGWLEGVELMRKFRIINTEYFINNQISKGKRILAEGAQGTMLDLDFGSYPFVTSSNTISAGACTGLGIPPSITGEVFGIFKAYCTRVGSGPFPTELNDETGEKIRKIGREYGATTGRPRRCGWLDLPALKYAIMINGVTKLFLTKADVLSGFESVKICTSYKTGGRRCNELPYDHSEKIDPVYTELPGWYENISGVKAYSDLPATLVDFIRFIENETNVPVTMVSVGPDRTQTILR